VSEPRDPADAPGAAGTIGLTALQGLVDLLDEAFKDEKFHLRTRLARLMLVPDAPDQVELEVLDLDGRSPADALIGHVAPDRCVALATLGGGWVAPVSMPGDEEFKRGRFAVRPSSHPEAVRVRSIVAVDRTGLSAGVTKLATGAVIGEPPTTGLVLDGLRRAFGLPTPAVDVPTSELLTSLWLTGITDAGQLALKWGRRLTWAAIARLHPALQLLAVTGPRPRPDALVGAARALGRVLTWEEVRHQCAERGWLDSWFPQGAAAWMDAGMLGRWLLSQLPPVPVLAAEALRYAGPDAARRLRDAFGELGITVGGAAA
jgi:hypothetical protein